MAYISSFKIDGIAGRKDNYQEDLNRDINIFFGANGSGKTSLLRILDSAMSGDASILRRVPFRSAEVTIHSSHYNRSFVRSIIRVDEDSSISHIPSLNRRDRDLLLDGEQLSWHDSAEPLSWTSKPSTPDTSKTNWQHIYLPTWRVFEAGRRSPGISSQQQAMFDSPPIIEREYDWDIIFAERLEQLWIRYSNKLLGEVQSIQGEGLASILRAVLASHVEGTEVEQLDSDTAYQLVGAFLKRQGTADILGSSEEFSVRYSGDPQLRRFVSEISTLEQRIGKAMASRNRLEDLIRSMFIQNKAVIFNSAGIEVRTTDGKEISLSSLSSGEKQSLRIFIDVLRAEQNTLLIDEPELSLHVDWQRSLIASMRELNPDTQLILATHSPEVMAEVPDDKIFRI